MKGPLSRRIAGASLMSSEQITLRAETGRTTGSRASRRLRRTGRVPAIVYGKHADPLAIAVDHRELRAALTTEAGTNALISLDVGAARRSSRFPESSRPTRSGVRSAMSTS
jgi:large subunit ribosomal protein L25